MPTWLTPLLKWGGILVAIVFAGTLIWVWQTTPGPEAGEQPTDGAPVTLYWVLLVAGVIAAIVGFVLDRRKGQPTN
jgi:UDP-N-acetylmuramyl pentapeptide phosphotransferase/UDP-N-acetylglucosamine-1-phosphate transferase